jgi:hypothetical protein
MIEIKTLYLGLDRYRIAVLRDGAAAYTIPATVGTVIRKRNHACDFWSSLGEEVIAGEIPEANDMRTKGQTKCRSGNNY